MFLALLVMGSSAFYVAWQKEWGVFPVGKFALISFGILLIIGHFSLQNKKLSKKIGRHGNASSENNQRPKTGLSS